MDNVQFDEIKKDIDLLKDISEGNIIAIMNIIKIRDSKVRISKDRLNELQAATILWCDDLENVLLDELGFVKLESTWACHRYKKDGINIYNNFLLNPKDITKISDIHALVYINIYTSKKIEKKIYSITELKQFLSEIT